MKLCKRCEISKPEKHFSKQVACSDGLKTWCRECCAEHNAEWRLNQEKPRGKRETIRAKKRELKMSRHQQTRTSYQPPKYKQFNRASGKWILVTPEPVALYMPGLFPAHLRK